MSARDRLVIIVVVAVVAVVGSWLLVIQPKRQQASQLGNQVQTVQSQLDTARTQVQQGELARRTFSGRYGDLVRLGEAVPADDEVPSLIYQIQNAAHTTHIDFHGLQLSSGTGAPSSPTTPSSTGQSSSATLPPGVVVGPAGFPAEQFSFTFQGSFFHLANFFHRLQRFVVATGNGVSVSGRLITFNGISLAAGPSGFPQIAATVSATTYILPASQGLVNGATPVGPAETSSTQPASTPASSTAAPAAVASPNK
jgi:type II secretory pathway pseudopilin PulG